MPLPPAHFLIGAGAAELTRTDPDMPRWRVWLVCGVAAVLPDMDTGVGILVGRGAEFHGIFTHSLVMSGVAAVLAWMVAGRRWGLAVGAAYLSHPLLDMLDYGGVRFWWPFSTREVGEGAPIVFTHVPWVTGEGPWVSALSLLQWDIFRFLLLETAIAAAFFGAAVLLMRAVRGSW